MAEHLRREGAIGKLDEEVVESEDESLRFYWARVSLPYYALDSIKGYRKAHEARLRSVGSVTPYIVPNGPSLPHIQAPRDSMQIRCEMLLADGLISGPVTINPLTKTLSVAYTDYEGNTPGPFRTVDEAVAWLGRNFELARRPARGGVLRPPR